MRADSCGPTLVWKRPPGERRSIERGARRGVVEGGRTGARSQADGPGGSIEGGRTGARSRADGPGGSIERFGPYDLYEEIGRVGLARSYRAMEREAARVGWDRPIVVERLRTEFSTDPDLIGAFIREAQLAHQLCHRHIARTFAFGILEGHHYCASELVEGPSLEDVLRQCDTAAGAMPVSVALALLIQLCDALHYLHNRPMRIIHRDISPANLAISRTGDLKLMDLGLAKTADGRPGTRFGVVKGTKGYVAPERLEGHFDERVDLFAIGVIAHELLVGSARFGGNFARALGHARERPVDPPSRWNPQVTRDLDDIVLTALQKDVSLRWQNAYAMKFALQAAGQATGIASPDDVTAWLRWAFSCQARRSTVIGKIVSAIDRSYRRVG